MRDHKLYYIEDLHTVLLRRTAGTTRPTDAGLMIVSSLQHSKTSQWPQISSDPMESTQVIHTTATVTSELGADAGEENSDF